MDRHASNALALAAWLERQASVQRVLYPGLPSHPQRSVAERQYRSGNGGGMLAFEVEGGRAAGKAIIDALQFRELTASLGERPHDGRPPAVDVAAPAVRDRAPGQWHCAAASFA